MTDPALRFEAADRIGKVTAVDTSRVYITVDDHALLTRTAVGNLVAVVGVSAQEYLIGMVERVTRHLGSEPAPDQEDAEGTMPFAEVQDDVVRAVLVGTYRAVDGSSQNVFKRGADSFPQIDRECFLIGAGNLQRLMELLGRDLSPEKRLQLGKFVIDKTATAVADGNRFFQRHAAILGSTGSGKSWAVSLILERASALKHPNLVVLDMHGEYLPLTEKGSGFAASLRVAGPGDLDGKADNVVFLPYWLLNREEMLAMLLDRSDSNAPNQSSRFTTHVRDLKSATLAALKKKDVQATFTVDSPIPYDVAELIRLLEADNTQMVQGKTGPKQGDWFGRLTRFIARLESKIEDRRYGFMFKPPKAAADYGWLAGQMCRFLSSDKTGSGIKVIDFSEVPSDVLPIVVGVFARLVYDVQFWLEESKRTPVCFVCDEAHLYLPVAQDANVTAVRALESFERIAKEGRKYGVSLLVISQRPSDVSRTILSQCNNFVALRLTNNEDQAVVRKLMPDSMTGLVDVLPLLDVGEAVVLGDAVLLPTRVKLDAPRIRPNSATRDFWTEWGVKPSDSTAIARAVETLRRQTRVG